MEYAPLEPLAAFLLDCVTRSDSRQRKDHSRIGHYRVRPAFVSCFFEEIEVLLSHLDIDLQSSFQASYI